MKITLGMRGDKIEFLNDNGSDFCMLTGEQYQRLADKPPLKNTIKIGLSVQKVPFKIDGVCYTILDFFDESGKVYRLKDEPILESSAIWNQPLRE